MKTTTSNPKGNDTVQPRACIIALHGLDYTSRMFKQADALHAAGFAVTMIGIVTRSDHPTAEVHPFGQLMRVETTKRLHSENGEPQADGNHGAGSHRGTVLAGIRTFAGRMKDNWFLAQAASKIAPDVVIASDLLAWVAGYLTKLRTRSALILDVRDLVLDAGDSCSRSYAWLLRHVEAFIVQRGDALVTVSEPLAEVLRQRYPNAPSAVAIYSGAFECVNRAEPPHEPLRLFFQGQFAKDRCLDEVIEAVARVSDLDVTLTLQGFGGIEAELHRLVEELGVSERVRFIPPCDPRDVVRSAAGFDVGVIAPRGDSLNYRVAVPAKLIDYIAAGLAVLASDLPGFRSVVELEQCGLLFEPTGVDAIEDAIRSLADDPATVMRMKENAVRAASRYLASSQERRLVEIVSRAIDPAEQAHRQGERNA
ncbi:MAG: glycosyltransferase [Anaerosomatales bacterium]|nr:glycosyltransferase [Anaerosomatales bacterium]